MKSLIVVLVVLVAIARAQGYSCVPGGGSSYYPGSGSLPPLPSGSGSLPPLPSGSGSLPPLPSGSMPPSGSYGPPLLTLDFAPEDFEDDRDEKHVSLHAGTWKPHRRHDKHYKHSHHHYNPSGSSYLPPYSGSGSMPPLPPCPSGSGYPGPSSYGPGPSGGSDPQPGSNSYFPSSGSFPSGGSWYPSSSGSIPPFGPPPSDMFEGGRDQGIPREARRF